MSNTINFWDYKHKAEEMEKVMSEIPIATIENVMTSSGATNPKNIKAIVLNKGESKKIVASVSKRYKLVQHKDAFKPIIDGLHITGSDYDFNLMQTDTKATLDMFVTEIGNSGLGGIRLGFRSISNIDGRNAIRYTIRQEKFMGTIEIVGYRQVCTNGMKIRVPLEQAEFVRQEIREKVESLLVMASSISHVGEVEKKIQAVQYVVEAMALLKEPVKAIIESARNKAVGEKKAKDLIGKYIGKRMSERILERYKTEENSLWGLYNAITFVASHNATIPTMNGLLNKSANLLERELMVKA